MKSASVFFLIMSIHTYIYAQTVSNIYSGIEKIDTSNVVLEYQRESIILGLNYSTVIITEVLYSKSANRYFIFGFIDNPNYSTTDLFKGRVDGISILEKKNGECIYTTATSRNGVFAFSLGEGEKARFYYALYVDLYIKRPE